MWTYWFMFAFIVIVLGGGSNNVAVIYVEELSACFLQEFYSIWPYIYYSIWSLIYFEFLFVYGVREWSNFILLHVAIY